jgi:hypothetical protein
VNAVDLIRPKEDVAQYSQDVDVRVVESSSVKSYTNECAIDLVPFLDPEVLPTA